jgi:hypothetical protein
MAKNKTDTPNGAILNGDMINGPILIGSDASNLSYYVTEKQQAINDRDYEIKHLFNNLQDIMNKWSPDLTTTETRNSLLRCIQLKDLIGFTLFLQQFYNKLDVNIDYATQANMDFIDNIKDLVHKLISIDKARGYPVNYLNFTDIAFLKQKISYVPNMKMFRLDADYEKMKCTNDLVCMSEKIEKMMHGVAKN